MQKVEWEAYPIEPRAKEAAKEKKQSRGKNDLLPL
jgi:hypothetical protein